MTLLAVSSAMLLLAAVAIAIQLTPRGTVAWLLAVALLAWALCVGTTGLAGLVLRDLSPGTLATLAAAWAAGALLVARRRAVLLSVQRVRARGASRAAWLALEWPPTAAAATLVTLALAWRTFLALRLPVVDLLGWQYHLVFVDVWLQANALVRVSQNQWTDGWPATGELLTTWLAAFTRTDALTGFTGLLPIPVAMVAVTGLARAFETSPRPALLAGLLFGMTPAVMAMAGTTYIDTAFAAAVAAAWWLGLRILRGERDRSAAFLFGIAAGLAVGMKGTAILLILPAGLGVLGAYAWDAARRARARLSARLPLLQITILILTGLALGGSWYVKNLLVHGNPAYPVGLGPFPGLPPGSYGAPPVPPQLAGMGWVEQVARSWAHDWLQIAYAYNVSPGGFGRAWLAVLPLAVLGLGILASRRSWITVGVVALPAVVALAALTSPWYARYTLFVPAVLLPAAALAIDWMRPALGRLVSLALVCVAAISVVLANAYPNARLPLPDGSNRATRYLAYILAPEADRSSRRVRRSCAAAEKIPPGARVVVARTFFLPHAVVGPDLDRIIIQPAGRIEGAADLHEHLVAMDVGWLVTRVGTDQDRVAVTNPDLFGPEGPICDDGKLWRVLD